MLLLCGLKIRNPEERPHVNVTTRSTIHCTTPNALGESKCRKRQYPPWDIPGKIPEPRVCWPLVFQIRLKKEDVPCHDWPMFLFDGPTSGKFVLVKIIIQGPCGAKEDTVHSSIFTLAKPAFKLVIGYLTSDEMSETLGQDISGFSVDHDHHTGRTISRSVPRGGGSRGFCRCSGSSPGEPPRRARIRRRAKPG